MATKKSASPASTERKTAPRSAAPKRRANFQFRAPGASQVCVAGSFNDWDPAARPLKQGKDGVFRTWMNLPAGIYEYRFVVDGEWRNDPERPETVPNPHGTENSLLVL